MGFTNGYHYLERYNWYELNCSGSGQHSQRLLCNIHFFENFGVIMVT